MFFKSFSAFVLAIFVALGLSIFLIFLVQCFPRQSIYVIYIMAIILLVVLTILILTYNSNKTTIKLAIGIALLVCLALMVFGIVAYRGTLKVSQAFMKHSAQYCAGNRLTLLYIPIFTFILGAFLIIIVKEYSAFVSVAEPSFDAAASIYYQVNSNAFAITMSLLTVHIIWGLSFIKDACKLLII